MWFDLHRHDMFSLFDGFGKPKECAAYAKELGYEALGISNHGNVTSLVQHYYACLDQGIKPILGIEAYFQPKFDKDSKSYHLCLFVKNRTGWENLMKMYSEASKTSFYRNPIFTFPLLKKYSEGIICTSACIGGPLSQMIAQGEPTKFKKWVDKFVEIFEDDFYIEVQPFYLNEDKNGKDLQEYVNERLIRAAEKRNIKWVVTSDAHYISKDDFDTYQIMHEIGNSKYGSHYKGRYMHSKEGITKMFSKMHGYRPAEAFFALREIYDKVEDGDWLQFDYSLPQLHDEDESVEETIYKKCVKGLKKKGKWKDERYQERIKYELDVINYHGFASYFLIVADYVNWAKENGIYVGPGRGSAGNCEVAYALGITETDAIYFDNDFERFMSKDRKKMPDIDLDFCTNRRDEVLEYIKNKYPGSVQICSYGIYQSKNLSNDLAKIFMMTEEESMIFKKEIMKYCNGDEFDIKKALSNSSLALLNNRYRNVIKHFSKLFGKIRYFGKHAAAVAITGDDFEKRCGVMYHSGTLKSAFDLNDIEKVHVLKLDVLGLKTVTQLGEIEDEVGEPFSYDMFEDERVYEYLREGKTAGIFQFESNTAKEILAKIQCENFNDVVAATSLNRPGPLKAHIDEMFLDAKENYSAKQAKKDPIKQYMLDSYGTLLYQEHILRICLNVCGFPFPEAEKIMKGIVPEDKEEEWKKKFVKALVKKGEMSLEDSQNLWEIAKNYLFNKGHGTSYAIISVQQMYYKIHYPLFFWRSALRYASDESKRSQYKAEMVYDGIVLFLPHVNGPVVDDIIEIEGDQCIQEGLSAIKNVGEAAVDYIYQERLVNGPYEDEDDFMNRIEKRKVNARVVKALKENGALEFDQDKLLKRIKNYNAAMYSRFERRS